MKRNILRILFLILIILTSLIIFGFSSQNGEESSGISSGIITKIADILNIENKEEFITKGEPIIRKMAHFGIYTMLGIWSMGFATTFNIKTKKQAIGTGLWGFLYASTDEIHQLFSNGRNGSMLDVLLDTSGVIFGIAIVILIKNINTVLKKKL